MAQLDRAGLIELLERLGAEDDGEALAAARGAHRTLAEAELSWDDVLVAESGDEDFDDGEDLDDPEDGDAPDAENEAPVPADLAEDAKIIDRLLARKTLSRETREELRDLKKDMKAGEYGAMDSRYVRALASRLEA